LLSVDLPSFDHTQNRIILNPFKSHYTSAISLAKALGLNSAVKILSTTLSEEVATDAKLSKANESAIAKTKKSEE
jgi:ferritin-like metal-binding protein YciE